MNENNLIQNNPFGINIALPRKTIQEVKKVVKQEFESLTVNPFVDFLENSDKVFSGETAREIRKYQAQVYALGQLMREGQAGSMFNVQV